MWFLWKWMGGLAACLPAPPLTLSPCTPSHGQPSTWAACLSLPSVNVCVSNGCVAARHRSTEQAHWAALMCGSLGHISGMWPCLLLCLVVPAHWPPVCWANAFPLVGWLVPAGFPPSHAGPLCVTNPLGDTRGPVCAQRAAKWLVLTLLLAGCFSSISFRLRFHPPRGDVLV